MAKEYRTLYPVKFYRDHLSHNIRPDGRRFDKYRPIVLNSQSISNVEGSAIAKIGKSTVMCGIKAELCQPQAEKPDEGFVVPNLELPALCSPKFKSGPPSEQAQASSKVIDDVIRNSGCIDLHHLCIARDKLAWCLYLDLVCLDYDGSVIDASLLALFTALKTVKLPTVIFDPATDSKLVNTDEWHPLKLLNTPVSTTFALFDEILVIDPTAEEESICNGTLTIVTIEDKLCSVLKPGGHPISEDALTESIKRSFQRSKLLLKLINNIIENPSADQIFVSPDSNVEMLA